MNETERLQYEKVQRSLNPKTRVLKVSRIEDDGTKNSAHVLDFGDRAVLHSEEGPALINEEQKKKE